MVFVVVAAAADALVVLGDTPFSSECNWEVLLLAAGDKGWLAPSLLCAEADAASVARAGSAGTGSLEAATTTSLVDIVVVDDGSSAFLEIDALVAFADDAVAALLLF